MATSSCLPSPSEKALRRSPIHRKNPDSTDLLALAVQTSHILRRSVGKPHIFLVGSLNPC